MAVAMTNAQIRAALQHMYASRSDISDAQYTTYINLALERLARNHDWFELNRKADLTLSASGTAAADKVVSTSGITALRDIYSVVIENSARSVRLSGMGAAEFDAAIPLPEYFARNVPQCYTLWTADEMLVHPVPDAAYTMRVRYRKWPAALSADADVPELTRKDDMLIFLTASFIWSLLREVDEANRYFA